MANDLRLRKLDSSILHLLEIDPDIVFDFSLIVKNEFALGLPFIPQVLDCFVYLIFSLAKNMPSST